MARKFHVEGTKTFLIWAIILAVLAIWHIWDGWFPRASWVERYPDVPETWYDFGLREFYTYNRVTGVLLSIAAVVLAYIHKVVK